MKAMDNNTVLFILGDHGMTAFGDHGGDSDEELTAALFVFSPRSLSESPAPINVSLYCLPFDKSTSSFTCDTEETYKTLKIA
jgi:hypothetical protein